MKKTFITTLLALVALAGQAQEIRTNNPTLGDYLHFKSIPHFYVLGIRII